MGEEHRPLAVAVGLVWPCSSLCSHPTPMANPHIPPCAPTPPQGDPNKALRDCVLMCPTGQEKERRYLCLECKIQIPKGDETAVNPYMPSCTGATQGPHRGSTGAARGSAQGQHGATAGAVTSVGWVQLLGWAWLIVGQHLPRGVHWAGICAAAS